MLSQSHLSQAQARGLAKFRKAVEVHAAVATLSSIQRHGRDYVCLHGEGEAVLVVKFARVDP